jgi:hypothetical protein
MAAHVVETAQLARQGVRQEDGLVDDRGRQEVAGTGEVVGVGDQLPGAAEDALFLGLEDRRVEVEPRRQRVGAGELGPVDSPECYKPGGGVTGGVALNPA